MQLPQCISRLQFSLKTFLLASLIAPPVLGLAGPRVWEFARSYLTAAKTRPVGGCGGCICVIVPDLDFWEHEFVPETADLTPDSIKHVKEVAAWLAREPAYQAVIMPSFTLNPELDLARRNTLADHFGSLGVASPHDVIVLAEVEVNEDDPELLGNVTFRFTREP